MLPKTGVFSRNEAAAHSDNCKKSNLLQVGAFAFEQVRYAPRRRCNAYRTCYKIGMLRIEIIEEDRVLTSVPESSETRIRLYNTHHLGPVFQQSGQSLEWGDVPL